MKQARKRYADTNTELGNMQMLFDEIWSVNERQAGERIRYLAQWNRADDTELDSIRFKKSDNSIVSLLFLTYRASGFVDHHFQRSLFRFHLRGMRLNVCQNNDTSHFLSSSRRKIVPQFI